MTIVRLGTYGVRIAAEHTPVDVIEISPNIAFANVEVDAMRKVIVIIVHRPVDEILGWVQRMRRVALIAVSVLSTGFIWRTNSPEFCPCTLLLPVNVSAGQFAGPYMNVVLLVLAEDPISEHCESVCPSFHPRNLNLSAMRINVRPVLVCFRIENIVLEVNAILSQNRNRSGRTLR